MLPALNTAASGLQQFQQDIDVIGNNIANVNTSGYKAERMDFEDAFSQALGSSPSLQVGSGLSAASMQGNFSTSTLSTTGDSSDLAINGNGFFTVKDPNTGACYVTQAGNFTLDASGYLITPGGQRLQGFSDIGLSTPGDIKIDGSGAPASAVADGAVLSSFSVSTSGTITVTMSDGTQFTRGQVLLQQFMNPDALVNQGNNLYTETAAAGAFSTKNTISANGATVSLGVAPGTGGMGTIQQGSLESSNVDLTTEMSNLITAQRAFEANAKIVTTSDEVLQDLVNLKR